MSTQIHYTNCPVCDSAKIQYVLTVKDYSVSKEEFAVWECNDCALRFTQDVPTQNTIGKYYQSEDYISHTNTQKGFINKLYQLVRKRTLVQKRKLVEKISGSKNGKLLDIGSGVGSFVKEMKTNGWETIGLEPDENARKVALQQNHITLQTIDTFFKLPTEHYDVITMWHVLEHVHELKEYGLQLRKLLKPGGKLIIAVPNYTAKDAVIYQDYWAAYDVPRHLYHFSPKAIKKFAANLGFMVAEMKPMVYDSFYISLLSSKYKNGKPNLIGAFMNGLKSNVSAIGNPEKSSSVIYILQ